MRVSFDLDGTAWKYRKELSTLANFLKSIGVEIYVITAHYVDLEERDKELWYARGFPTVDTWVCRVTKEEQETPCGVWKAEKIVEHQIDIHFEDFDSGRYKKTFYDSLYELDYDIEKYKIIDVNEVSK